MLIDAMRMVRGHAKDLTLPAPDSEDHILLARRLRLPSTDSLHDELHQQLHDTKTLTDRLEDFLAGAALVEPATS
jgi:hypothetical protein